MVNLRTDAANLSLVVQDDPNAALLNKPEQSIFLTTVNKRLTGPAHKVMNTMNLFVQREIIYSYGSIQSFLDIIGENPVDFSFDRRRFYRTFSGNDGKYRYERLATGIISLREFTFAFGSPEDETLLAFGLINQGKITKDNQVHFQIPAKALYLLTSRERSRYVSIDLTQANHLLNGKAALPLYELIMFVSNSVSGTYEVPHERMKRGLGVPYEKTKKKDEWKSTVNAPSQIYREYVEKGLEEIQEGALFQHLSVSFRKTSDGEITWFIEVDFKDDRLSNVPSELLPELTVVIEKLIEFGCEDLIELIEDEYTLRYAEYNLKKAHEKIPNDSRLKNKRQSAYLRACFKNNKNAFAKEYEEYRLSEIERKKKQEELNRKLGRMQRRQHAETYRQERFLQWLRSVSESGISTMKKHLIAQYPSMKRDIEKITVDSLISGRVSPMLESHCRVYCMEINGITEEVIEEATKSWTFTHTNSI